MAAMKRCRRTLALIWMVGAGVLFLILILQTMFGKYQQPQEAFNWLMPTLLPTLTLIVGVFVAERSEGADEAEADSFKYRLALWLSVAYLLIVSLTIFIEPFSDMEAEQLMKTSNLWLSPMQGLVAAVVGIFFIKKG